MDPKIARIQEIVLKNWTRKSKIECPPELFRIIQRMATTKDLFHGTWHYQNRTSQTESSRQHYITEYEIQRNVLAIDKKNHNFEMLLENTKGYDQMTMFGEDENEEVSSKTKKGLRLAPSPPLVTL